MYDNKRPDTTIYQVVVNDEEQYSIWPADREPPLGWRSAGKVGTREECLDYIEEVWTDLRPLSLRKRMEEAAHRRAEGKGAALMADAEGEDQAYQVVVNDDGLYSAWPADDKVPEGWTPVGKGGINKEELLRILEELWTDMRPDR